MAQKDMFRKPLTRELAHAEAVSFAINHKPLPSGVPQKNGNTIEAAFIERLRKRGYSFETKGQADLASINVDIKTWAAGCSNSEMKGCGRGGMPPGYDVILFIYREANGELAIINAEYIASEAIAWKQMNIWAGTIPRAVISAYSTSA